jgi:hypothetical protein
MESISVNDDFVEQKPMNSLNNKFIQCFFSAKAKEVLREQSRKEEVGRGSGGGRW